jgi:hypothetical protein
VTYKSKREWLDECPPDSLQQEGRQQIELQDELFLTEQETNQEEGEL